MHSSSELDVHLRFGDYHDKKLGLPARMHLPLSKTGNKIERISYGLHMCTNIILSCKRHKKIFVLSKIFHPQQTTGNNTDVFHNTQYFYTRI